MRDNCADSSPELGGSVEFDWDAFDRKGSVPTIDVLEKCHLRIACKTYILSPSGNKLEECGCWHFLIVSGRKYVCLCSARSFYFRRMCKMSFTQNRRGDFQGIKTRELILQDPSGSFPPLNSFLIVGDEKGGITTTQNLTIPQAAIELQELTTAADATGRYIRLNNGGLDFLNKAGNVANPGEFSINKSPVNGHFNLLTTTVGKTNMNIDDAGNMILSGFSTQFATSSPAASDITVNGNVTIGGPDPQRTGTLTAQTVVLDDKVNTGKGRIWSSNNELYWQSPNGIGSMLTQWVELFAATGDPITRIPEGSQLPAVITALNQIIDLFNSRNIFFQTAYQLRPILFHTPLTVRITSGAITNYFDISPEQLYTDVSGLTSALAAVGFPVVFDTNLQKTYINVQNSPVTIRDESSKGSAQRLLNHLGFSNLDGTRILTVPPSGVLTIQNPIYGRVITGNGSDPTAGTKLVLPNPTNATISPSSIGSRNASISFLNQVPTDASYDTLQFFGIYLIDSQGSRILQNDIVTAPALNQPVQYTFYQLQSNTSYNYAVTSIGTYDESGVDVVYSFTTGLDATVPQSTGMLLTQFSPATTIPNVIPFNTSTYGNPTGVVLDSSGIADPSSHVIPYDVMVVESYLYASTFTVTFPDTYRNVYIGFYAPDGGTVDAYRLRISGGITSVDGVGMWDQQEVFGTGVAQYFRVNTFTAGTTYQASLVAMNAFTQSYTYSLGIFIVQVQDGFDTGLVDSYRYFSPTLDQYPRIPFLSFCSAPVP